MTSNFIKIILIVSLISKPVMCHALAFLGMTRCQDLFLVHLQGWKLGTSFLRSLTTFTYISLARLSYLQGCMRTVVFVAGHMTAFDKKSEEI
ncbi:unnamed protein product [Nyctereutes procyonoides]|uniref:(raccoon dog) hypothetical protein n=1 Tax=Nyctereutes procyonoides TaxID=34880 RepID=A0A811Y316_NYCPR|nr:unnamed protein product [Nyctereutes procyonoides]